MTSNAATAVPATLRVLGLRLARDRFLVGTSMYIIAISVVMRWAIPYVTAGVGERWGLDLTPYHPLLMSHVLIQLAPLLGGMIGAFLLLESREERILHALLVTPTRLTTYLLVLGAGSVVVSVIVTMAEAPIIGHALPPGSALLAAAVLGALSAPTIAFAVAAAATNKTEAFAYLKILGVAPLFVSGAYFAAEPLQWIAGIYPPYWAVKAYWVAEAGGAGWGLWIAGGAAVTALWLAGAARLFLWASRK